MLGSGELMPAVGRQTRQAREPEPGFVGPELPAPGQVDLVAAAGASDDENLLDVGLQRPGQSQRPAVVHPVDHSRGIRAEMSHGVRR